MEAGHRADYQRGTQPCAEREVRDDKAPVAVDGKAGGDADAARNPKRAADRREQHGLCEELRRDVAAGGSERPARADLAAPRLAFYLEHLGRTLKRPERLALAAVLERGVSPGRSLKGTVPSNAAAQGCWLLEFVESVQDRDRQNALRAEAAARLRAMSARRGRGDAFA